MKRIATARLGPTLAVVFTAAAVLLSSACSRPAKEPAASDAPLSLSIALSTNSMLIGDVFEVRVTATHPHGATVELPPLARGKELVIRNTSTRTREISEARTETEYVFQAASLVVGQHVVSTGLVRCATADGQTLTEPLPFASFEVASALSAPDETLRDIKGLEKWPGTVPRWVWVLALIAVVAAVAGYLASRALSKPRTILHYPPPEPPDQAALRRLRALKAKGWIESLNVEPFFVELSGIVRRYLEDRFKLRAPERTTEEFIREASDSRLLTGEQQQLTRDFLEQSDLVKFARHTPAGPDMEAALSAAERLVVETAHTPAQPPEVASP